MPLRDIASARGVSQSFLAKIFQKLTRYGIVRSFRGAGRGYALARPPKRIKLKAILLAIEGPDIFERCIFWSDLCADSNPCPLHEQWKQIKEKAFGKLMEQTTLADLMKKTAASRYEGLKSGRWRSERREGVDVPPALRESHRRSETGSPGD